MKLSALFSLVLAAVAIAAPHGRRAEEETGATTNSTTPATGGEVFRPAPPGALAAGSRPIQLSEITAIDVLQYALSAENLETAFYNNIQKFSAKDFEDAGYAPEIRERYLQITENEKTHIDVLKAVITAAGVKPVPPCTYAFPGVTSVQAFLDVTHQFENVGAAAYAGAAAYIVDAPAYLTAAGGILATEARHAAWIGSTVFNQNPWNSAFETPLSFRQIWTIATEFVDSCSEDMSYVPGFTDTFPRLKVDLSEYEATGKAKLIYTPAPGTEADLEGKQLYVAWNQGTGVLYSPIDAETNETPVPAGLKGFVFPLITTESGSVADEHVVAGATVSQFGFAGNGTTFKAL